MASAFFAKAGCPLALFFRQAARKENITAFGFPAYHTEQYFAGIGKSADLRAAVRETLNALAWSLREEAGDQLIASTGVNMRSWGEKVLISFLPDNSISVTSKCKLPTQCCDWGKNKANVRRFMEEIRKHVQQPAAPDGVPLPHKKALRTDTNN